MSTEPYPDITVDESGIVPPQSGRGHDWPKKIRTLTAAELDRLTIDGAGRFYWDGKLVNYEPPTPKEPEPKASEPAEGSDMDAIDRALAELGEQSATEPSDRMEPTKVPAQSERERSETPSVELDIGRHVAQIAAAVPAAAATHAIGSADRVRLTLSRWQSLGAIIVVLGILVGASGVAAYGWVMAHDWGCRVGMFKRYCPTMPNPASRPPRADIPA